MKRIFPIFWFFEVVEVPTFGLCVHHDLKVSNMFYFQVYGYARKFAKIGIAEALVDSLSAGVSSHDLISACITLRAVAVNVSEVKSNPTLSMKNCVCIESS